jgi:hypothetical protein
MDPDAQAGPGWSGSMLVANPICWFCRDAAHISNILKCNHKQTVSRFMLMNISSYLSSAYTLRIPCLHIETVIII